MSREVVHDGTGMLHVRFPFDRRLVDMIKTLPRRRWNAEDRLWSVPDEDVIDLVDLLRPERFRFDAATVERYRALGGTAEIDEVAGATPRRARGLFDTDDVDRTDRNDLTVSRLNEQVQAVLQSAFPAPIWVVGEVSGFNRNTHKRHVSFQIVEREDDGKTVSSVDATLFERTRRQVEQALASAGDPFRLEDEIQVRVLARVELYVPWGSYRVIVEELDVNYTLGEAARRREEIVRKLTAEGLVGRNTSLGFPALPLRVGLITSLGSDAYKDVLRTLEESGYAFRILAHGARVQGRATEPSVLNALDALRRCGDELDVVIVCRGGGARTDLAWFDSEALGRAVASYPIPVLIGIGHEQDQSVLDAVGWRHKTPTAAARFLVDTVGDAIDRVERTGRDALTAAARRVEHEQLVGAERGRRLANASRGLVATARERLIRWVRDVPRASTVQLVRQRAFLDAARRAIVQGARRDVASAGRWLTELATTIGPRSSRVLSAETERLESRVRRARLVDPIQVLERGYAILRSSAGSVLTDPDAAPDGCEVQAQLRGGRLRLVSRGRDMTNEGDDG